MKAIGLATLVGIGLMTSAMANPAEDLSLTQAQSAMFQAEAKYFAALANRLQAEAATAAAKQAAIARYWQTYVEGLKPAAHPVAPPKAPQPPGAMAPHPERGNHR